MTSTSSVYRQSNICNRLPVSHQYFTSISPASGLSAKWNHKVGMTLLSFIGTPEHLRQIFWWTAFDPWAAPPALEIEGVSKGCPGWCSWAFFDHHLVGAGALEVVYTCTIIERISNTSYGHCDGHVSPVILHTYLFSQSNGLRMENVSKYWVTLY